MTITVVSWAGHAINDGTTYQARLTYASAPMTRTAAQVQVQPPGSWPRHIRADQQPRTIALTVFMLSPTQTLQRQLQEWFAPGSEGELRITDDGVGKVLNAVSLGATAYAGAPNMFVATLVAADPRWRGTDPIAAARLMTASGQSFIVNNPGNSPVDDCVIAIRPTVNKAAADGYLYKSEAIIAWLAERPSALYSIDITGGGWDHATEVGAGRSQADGDDVRVIVDGIEVPRWLGEHADNNANSALTTVWDNLSYSPRRTLTVLAAITAIVPNADGELEVTKGSTLGWPRQGAIRLENEVILYTGRTEANASGNAAFTGVTRAGRNTTAASHAASAVGYWIEHRIQLVYGNTGVAAPDARADVKPMLDFTAATPAALSNVIHTWINFADDTNVGRSMQWGRRLRSQDDQADKILAPGGSPAANMTLEYQSGGAVSGKPAYNTWFRDIPTGSGSSGGNIASITRALADTLGMWAYGIDDAGQEVVLEKYAGVLASGSDTITAPTNPAYRCEFWGFNQVLAKRPDPASLYATTIALTAAPTGFAVQFRTGSEPTEIVGAILKITDSVGGATVTCSVEQDVADTLSSGVLASATYATTAAGAQVASFSFSTPLVLQPDTDYWLGFDDGAGATTSIFYGWIAYQGLKVAWSGSYILGVGYDFTIYGRPAPLAASVVRYDAYAYADDSDQGTIDGVTFYLSATETPFVALKARQAIYRFAPATLYNETTGQSIQINTACAVGAELRIDIGGGVAVNLDDEDATSFAAGVEYSDPAARFTLAPGDNVLRFVETGLAGVNVSVEAQPCWE